MPTRKIDFSVIQQLVLCELQRQGIEFARVKVLENYSDFDTTHLTIETFTRQQLAPKYVETMRISNQLKHCTVNSSQPRPCPLCGAQHVTFLVNQNNRPCCAECGYPCHLYDEFDLNRQNTDNCSKQSEDRLEES